MIPLARRRFTIIGVLISIVDGKAITPQEYNRGIASPLALHTFHYR